MTDEDHALRRIKKLEDALAAEGGRENNSSGTRRLGIASEYEKLGRTREAAHWYTEAARHAEFSENFVAALVAAKAAVRVAPDELSTQREYRRLWKKYMGDTEPDPVT